MKTQYKMLIGLGVIIIIFLLFNPQLEGIDGQIAEQPNGQIAEQPNGQPRVPTQPEFNAHVQAAINNYKGYSEQYKNWYRNLPIDTQQEIQRIVNEWVRIVENPTVNAN